jgi:NADH:ubiquinone oxidoreductase subunit 4 (subunit M)
MNMVVLGIFALTETALDGALYLMIGHGIISSALFFAVGIIYERFHTRLIRYYSGLIQIMPIFGIFFLLFTLGNIGFPLTSNFIGESLIIIGLFLKTQFITILSGFGIIFAAIYSF